MSPPLSASPQLLEPLSSPPLTLEPRAFQPPRPYQVISETSTPSSGLHNMPPPTDLPAQPTESGFKRSLRKFADTLKKRTAVQPTTATSISTPNSMKANPRVIVHLMRHAESEHNLAHLHGRNREDYKDPELTARGVRQCQKAAANFPYMDEITIILCSPLRRTMQTALLTFQPLYLRGLKLILWPALREWGNGQSNIGYPVAEMKKEMAGLPVDLRLLNEGWELETDPYDEGPERSNRVRKDLYELGETFLTGGTWKDIPMENHAGPVHIMVVSHGGFLANVIRGDAALYNTDYKSLCFSSEEQIANGISKYRLFDLGGSAES